MVDLTGVFGPVATGVAVGLEVISCGALVAFDKVPRGLRSLLVTLAATSGLYIGLSMGVLGAIPDVAPQHNNMNCPASPPPGKKPRTGDSSSLANRIIVNSLVAG